MFTVEWLELKTAEIKKKNLGGKTDYCKSWDDGFCTATRLIIEAAKEKQKR